MATPELEELLKQQQVPITTNSGIVIRYGGETTVQSSQQGVTVQAMP